MGVLRMAATLFVTGTLVVQGAFAVLGRAAEAEIEKKLRSRHFVAKIDIYDAVVFESGRVDSEEDDEAIRAGFPIVIKTVWFFQRGIRLDLRHPYIHETTHIEFRFLEKLSSDFSREKEIFEKMLASVFEEKKGGE